MANGIPRIWPLPPDDELQRVERGRERNAQGFQFIKDDLRSEADRRNAGLFSGGGERTTSGASSTAHYLTSQAESGLSNEVNLGALTTGILKHTVSAGVSTPATAVAGTDYVAIGANSNLTNLTGLTGSLATPTDITLANNATIDAGTGVGNAYKLRARATTGGVWVDLITLTNAALAPTLDFPTGATWNANYIYHATGTDVPVTDGGTGASTAAGALTNLGAGAPYTSAMVPIIPQPDNTQVSSSVSDTKYATYLGKCPIAATSFAIRMRVTTAYATGGAGPWAEIGIASGTPVIGGNPVLTILGTTDVSGTFTPANTNVSTTITATAAAGTDLWIVHGSKGTTPYVVRGVIADQMIKGFTATYAVAGAISTIGAGTTFTASGSASGAACAVYPS